MTIAFRPYQAILELLAQYYQAADLYVHAAHVDTFPNMVIEALACGIPVVATDIGGIPEQIKPLIHGQNEMDADRCTSTNKFDATGILVPPHDATKLANAILFLLENDVMRKRLGANAAVDAKIRFDEKRMVQGYLDWYQDIARPVVDMYGRDNNLTCSCCAKRRTNLAALYRQCSEPDISAQGTHRS